MFREEDSWRESIENFKWLLETFLPVEDIVSSISSQDQLKLVLDFYEPLDILLWAILDREENQDFISFFLDYPQLFSSQEDEKRDLMGALRRSHMALYQVLEIKEDQVLARDIFRQRPLYFSYSPRDFHPQEKNLFIGRMVQLEGGNYLVHGTACFNIFEATYLKSLRDFYILEYGYFSPNFFMPDQLKARGNEFMLFTTYAKNLLREMGLSQGRGLKDLAPSGGMDLPAFKLVDGEELGPLGLGDLALEEDILWTLYFAEEVLLQEEAGSLNRLEDLDLQALLGDLAREGAFVSDRHLARFIHFLDQLEGGLDPRDLDQIKSQVTAYKKALQESYRGFYVDEGVRKILEGMDQEAYGNHLFLYGFERYMDEVLHGEGMGLTKRGRLNSASLQNLADILDLKALGQLKRPDQRHFPMVHIWQSFAKLKGFVQRNPLNKDQIEGTGKYYYYLQLSLQDRLGLWLTTLFGEAFSKLAFEKEKGAFFSKDYRDFRAKLEKIFSYLAKKGASNEKTLDLLLEVDMAYFRDLLEGVYLLKRQEEGEDFVYSLSALGQKIGAYFALIQEEAPPRPLAFPKGDLKL
ncbi:MAG: hypothetical protein Q4E37_05280 [Tissierellia bacterium]|nr:hypothetical protein [Tissierellia bacterium]